MTVLELERDGDLKPIHGDSELEVSALGRRLGPAESESRPLRAVTGSGGRHRRIPATEEHCRAASAAAGTVTVMRLLAPAP